MKLDAKLEQFLTLKTKQNKFSISVKFLFQLRCASSASTAAIFRQSAGYVNCSLTIEVIVNVLVSLRQIFRLSFLRFSSVVDFSSEFFTLSHFILSDLYCAHSELNLVAKRKLIAE